LTFGPTLTPGYDAHEQPISDRGIIPETANFFNLTVIVLGILMIGGGYLLHRCSSSRVTTAIFIIAGIGVIGVGIFTLNNGIHGIFALISFIFFNVLAMVAGVRANGLMRIFSIILGVLGLTGLILHLTDNNGPLGPGGMERLIVYPVMVWLLAYSGCLISRTTSQMRIASR
jgi:hypothetical membrane protein